MADMTHADLEMAVEDCLDPVAASIFDAPFEARIDSAADPSEFEIAPDRLAAAARIAFAATPAHVTAAVPLPGGGVLSVAAPDLDDLLSTADEKQRRAAADAVRRALCTRWRDWFEAHLDEVKEWLAALGLRETLMRMRPVAKKLTVAAVEAMAAVSGSTFLAHLHVALAVAAVGAALLFIARHGLSDYCAG